jgi:hypothetical protein
MGYTKLFNDLIFSTVWREADSVRLLWITMLALKDRHHRVNASVPGLADAAKISLEDCEEALNVLSSPDPYSRSTDFEGRRIDKCEGGWLILNGEKYRNKMNLLDRREYQRIKQQEYRDRRRLEREEKGFTKDDENVNVYNPVNASQQFTHTEADTEADTYTDKNKKKKGKSAPRKKKTPFRAPSESEVQAYFTEKGLAHNDSFVQARKFVRYYEAADWRVNRGAKAMENWKLSAANWMNRREGVLSDEPSVSSVRSSHKSLVGWEPAEDALPEDLR